MSGLFCVPNKAFDIKSTLVVLIAGPVHNTLSRAVRFHMPVAPGDIHRKGFTMKQITIRILPLLLVLGMASAQAVSPVGQHHIDRLAAGGPSTVRDTAKTIQASGNSEVEVLDALAERIGRDYNKSGNTQIDATAWGLRALGDSGNSRYRDLVQDIAKNAQHKKVKKFANNAAKKLKNGSAEQYRMGSTTLAASPQAPVASNTSAAKVAATGKLAISEISVGMSQQEVESLAGSPTSVNSHITGKGFNPFNVTGRDAHRTVYYYKGQGRVVFSNQSVYSGVYRVSDVVLDSLESGYP